MVERDNRLAQWRSRYPTVAELEPLAKRRVPRFAFDFLLGGTGDELNCARNRQALREVEIVPRYAVDISKVDISVSLFGRKYSSPVLIAPIGMDGAIWPGAGRCLAETARDLNIGYMPSTVSATAIEEIARIAPDNVWFQLYGVPADDHKVTFDMIRRAEEAGVHTLAVTLDIPTPARRVRDMRNGLTPRIRITPGKIASMLTKPAWLAGLVREGAPVIANARPYCRPGAGKTEIEEFTGKARFGSGVVWETIARIRDKWKRPLLVKGVLHPADAERALALGLDGLVVSNHGGRQFEAAPAPIDVLPAIRATVGERMAVLMDGGIMSGTDALVAIARGADAVLAGRGFMLGLGALGDDGARHVATTFSDELRIGLAQTGVTDLGGVRGLSARHRGAWRAEEFKASSAGE